MLLKPATMRASSQAQQQWASRLWQRRRPPAAAAPPARQSQPGRQRGWHTQRDALARARAPQAPGGAGREVAPVAVSSATPAASAGGAGKASALSSTSTLINVAVGAGVLSMPYAFSNSGWQLGVALTGMGGLLAIEPWDVTLPALHFASIEELSGIPHCSLCSAGGSGGDLHAVRDLHFCGADRRPLLRCPGAWFLHL